MLESVLEELQDLVEDVSENDCNAITFIITSVTWKCS